MYFCQFADGGLIGLCVYDAADPPAVPIFPGTTITTKVEPLWPGDHGAPAHPQKVDHIAFNVESRADVEWYRQRLLDHGVEVSEVVDYKEPSGAGWLISIYFFDPSGNPLEIATFDFTDPDVEERLGRELWFSDPDPVAGLDKAR
jgi:catechol 2,3-dioxygenase-like lactoylglutathione lyase family enzyme